VTSVIAQLYRREYFANSLEEPDLDQFHNARTVRN